MKNLNECFGELRWNEEYKQPTMIEIVSTTITPPQFNITHVKNALLKIRKAATSPYKIPFWVWKENADELAPVMTKVWNESCLHQHGRPLGKLLT